MASSVVESGEPVTEAEDVTSSPTPTAAAEQPQPQAEVGADRAKDMLVVNMFGMAMKSRVIYRHLVHIRLVTKKGQEFILSSYNSSARGDRVSKQMDNQRLIAYLLSKPGAGQPTVTRPDADVLPQPDYATTYEDGTPISVYDGASVLCSLKEIDFHAQVDVEELNTREEITFYMRDSLQYTEGHLDVRISLDVDLPWINQTDPAILTDPRFYQYLEILTSQYPLMKGTYVSFRSGLMVHSVAKERVKKAEWAFMSTSIHKACKVVDGGGNPMPVVELDPRSVLIFNSITLAELVLSITRNKNWFASKEEFEKIRRLVQEVKCFHFFENSKKWSSTVHTVKNLKMLSPEEKAEKFKNYSQLQFDHWPAAVCGTSHMTRFYPFEYLRIVPWQQVHAVKLALFDLVPRAMLPRDRWSLVQKHFTELSLGGNPILESFGVTVCNNPIDNVAVIPAERGQAPSVKFDGRAVLVSDENRDWRPRSENYTRAGKVGFLVVAVISHPNFDPNNIKRNIDEIIRRARERKIVFGHVEYFPVFYEQANGHTVYDYVEAAFKHTAQYCKEKSCTGLLLLVSEMIDDLHACLKLEERLNDIPSQHLLCSTISDPVNAGPGGFRGGGRGGRGGRVGVVGGKSRSQTIDNIVLKLNIKTGGINYTADSSDHPGMSLPDKKMFIFGLDVAHPEIGQRDGLTPSCVGMACNSTDIPYSFLGDFAYTTPKQEAIQDTILETFAVRHAERYVENHGELPERLAIFRDGMSEGQEADAMRECQTIEKALLAVAHDMGKHDYKPKVLCVVVRKRHNTRLYRKGHNNDPSNPLPDTAVTGVISTYGKREIFLQAFRTIQGTSCVPIFWVIRDDEQHSDAQLTDMVTAICNLHQIVHSPTSIPTPVYVAHELAKRGADLLRAWRLKVGPTSGDENWATLTNLLCYENCPNLSKLRIV